MEWFRQTEVPALQRNTKAKQAESAEDKISWVKCRARVPFVTQESLFVNENLIL